MFFVVFFSWGGCVGIEMVVVQQSDEYAHTDGEEVVRFPNYIVYTKVEVRDPD